MAPRTEVLQPEIEQPESETHESEPARPRSDESAERLRQAKQNQAEIAIAVGLALLRSNLDRDEYYGEEYGGAIFDSPYAMSLIEEIPKAYELSDDWLAETVRQVLRANGQNVDDDADVTPLVAAAKKVTTAYAEGDDYFEIFLLAKYMFAAGRLSREAETRPL